MEECNVALNMNYKKMENKRESEERLLTRGIEERGRTREREGKFIMFIEVHLT